MKQTVASRADLVRAISSGVAVYSYVAEQLGLEHQPTAAKETGSVLTDDILQEDAPPEEEETEGDSKQVQPRPGVPFWQPCLWFDRKPKYGRLIDTDYGSEGDNPPSTADSPPVPVVVQPFAPLATFTDVLTRLRHQTELARPGRMIDINRLVSELSQARDLDRVPRLNRRTWGERLHVVIDLARRLIPYREDQREIAKQLKRLLPNSGTSVSILRERHEQPWIQWPEELEGSPMDPAPGDTILALSDLGTLDQTSCLAEKIWERLGRSWVDRQCRMLALVPCRVDHLPGQMTALWQPVQWDRFSSLGPTPSEEETVAARERLLALLSQAVRIEPQLVRAVRRLFVEGLRDPGLESLVWQVCSKGSSDHCTAAGLSRDQAERFQIQIAGDELSQLAWELIQAFHKGEYEGIRITECSNLSAESWKLLNSSDRRRVRDWFDTLWNVVKVHGEDADERADFFIRVSPLLSADAFERLPALHRLQHRLCPDDPAPKGYDPALAGVQDAPMQSIRIWQVGGQFEFRRRGEQPARSSPLATIRLKNPEIVIDSLDEWPDDNSGERFWLDGVAPEWADRWGRDQFGLWAEFVIGDVRQRMRWIPPGEFLMGSPASEAGQNMDELPQQPVTISRGFWLFDTPCTQELWEAVMGQNPSRFKGVRRPVENVSWDDCQKFHERLCQCCPGLSLRLPTEAEWEYACRAGTKSATYADDGVLENIAWYGGNSGGQSHDVGQLRPNRFGLFDMLGNVWEWCRDYSGRRYTPELIADPQHKRSVSSTDRVVRGGSWGSSARGVRAAYRYGDRPGNRVNDLGFRCSSSGSEPRVQEWKESRRPQVVRSQRAVRGRRPIAEPAGDSEQASEDRLLRLTDRDVEYAPVPQGPIVRLRTDLEEVFLCQTPRPPWASRVGRDQFGLWAEITVPCKTHGEVRQRLRWMPPGRFLMGSPESEKGRYSNEGPQHEVALANGFWLFETPCTQSLWEAVMGDNPSRFKGDRRPVETVDWNQASEFVARLSEIVGLQLRLPSETQWEYACRAGCEAATYAGDFDPDDPATQGELQQIAWYSANAQGATHDVAQLLPNPWGLYDMLGNVWEWCDCYDQLRQEDPSSALRVIRGGGWGNPALFVRAAYRVGLHPRDRGGHLGFRCSSSGEEEGTGNAEPERSGRSRRGAGVDSAAKSDESMFQRLKNWLTDN
ncbi:MAG: formylglycine-generating enzyme family protein [Planctomycetaceae bacterium]|nr:formylglycine-generating enzyme family protein [Planctomycetaceae bacterium]